MPQTCTICRHPHRLQIEQALLTGTSLRDIAGRYGPGKTIVARHRAHIAGTIAEQTQARDIARTATLLEDIRAGEGRAERLYETAQEILKDALEGRDARTALQAIKTAVDVMGEARDYQKFRGELTGELSRDRVGSAMSIQIICPSVPSPELAPRISFATEDAIEYSTESIGIRQLP